MQKECALGRDACDFLGVLVKRRWRWRRRRRRRKRRKWRRL